MQKQHIAGRKRRRELLENIKNRINAIESRQDIFNDLSTKYIEQDWLASFIANVPNPEDIQKMKKGSSFIFITFCIYSAIHIISIFITMTPMIMSNKKLIFVLPMTFFWPAIAIWCALRIKAYHGASYRVAGWVAIVLSLNNLSGLFKMPAADVLSWTISIIVISLLSVSSFLAFKIRKTYFPHLAFQGARKENGRYLLSRS
ncbi:MAG: hypothetical protein AABZ15_14205 [Nitrospirota bacterium]